MTGRAMVVSLVAALGLVGGFSACGGDDDDGASAGSTAGSGATTATTTTAPAVKQATGKPIKMMVISTVGTPAVSLPEAFTGARAAADAINASGGVKGRPIDITTCNDKLTPEGGVACARKAVADGDDVVQMTTNFGSSVYPVLEAAQLPAVGDSMFSAEDFSNPLSFPLIPGSNIMFEASPLMAKAAGATSISSLAFDIGTALQNADRVKEGAEAAGLEYKGTVKLPLDATDLSPYIQQLKSSGTDAVVLIVAAASVPNILKTAQTLGFETTWTGYPDVAATEVLKQSGDLQDGMLIASPYPQPSDPRWRQYNEEVDAAEAAGLKFTDRRDGIQMVHPWAAVHAVQAIGESMSGQLSRETLLAALKGTSTPLDVGGLVSWTPNATGPAKYPRVANGTIYPLIVKDGELVANGSPIDTYQELGLE